MNRLEITVSVYYRFFIVLIIVHDNFGRQFTELLFIEGGKKIIVSRNDIENLSTTADLYWVQFQRQLP